MGISLRIRTCLKKLSLKEWGIAIGLLIVSFLITMGIQPLVPVFADAVGLSIPDYMPFFLNPEIDPMNTDPAILSPGLDLQGNYAVLLLMGVTLFLNILTEEVYFRGWMLPKLARYGAWSWVINGVLFAFYHTFQLWLLPVLLVASLSFAYVTNRTKSIWPALVMHLITNTLSLLAVLALIAG